MYDRTARVLHDQLTNYDPFFSTDNRVRWNTVRSVAAALCAEFDGDPSFDYDRFLGIVMSGWKNSDV